MVNNANLSEKAYKDWKQSDVDNGTIAYKGEDGSEWSVYAVSGDQQDNIGFYGVAFQDTVTGEIVVAYRGTDGFAKDSASDIQITLGVNLPNQYGRAEAFYDEVATKADHENSAPPSVTGHSLGGALAQLVGAAKDVEGYTYNAPGVKEYMPQLGLPDDSYENIYNYNAAGDIFSSIGTQIGISQTVPIEFNFSINGIWDLSPVVQLGKFLFGQHYIDNMARALYGNGSDKAIDAIRDFFQLATQQSSPLILDLDADGIETTGVRAGTCFDHGGEGFAEQTGWVGQDDGLLVMDRNGNGLIDIGAELFGNNTLLENGTKAANGFAALTELDTNHDGKVDAQDAAFTALRIWKDSNGDGISATNEVLTLAEAGVQTIATGYTTSILVDSVGNAHKQTGSFTRTDGSSGTASDVWFAVDRVHSIATEWLYVPVDIAALPDAKGYGTVYNLHQAMVRDESGVLQTLVAQFIAAESVAERNDLTEKIIYKWAGVDGVIADSRGPYVDARKLASLELFLDDQFLQRGTYTNPYPQASQVITQGFEALRELVFVYGQVHRFAIIFCSCRVFLNKCKKNVRRPV